VPQRLDLRPLLEGLWEGLRRRRSIAESELPDYWTRGILFGVPVAAIVVVAVLRIRLGGADQLLAGTALLAGALLTGFGQIATWRERLLQRPVTVTGSRLRALNEAVAHVLVCLVVSLIATACVIVLANLDLTDARLVVMGIEVGFSALAVASFSYIFIALVIVVNLLWDAFREEESDASAQHLPQFDDPNHD
jgi:hypothetical protein